MLAHALTMRIDVVSRPRDRVSEAALAVVVALREIRDAFYAPRLTRAHHRRHAADIRMLKSRYMLLREICYAPH